VGCLRLFLALSVVLGHTTPLFGFQGMPASTAVPIFFMISGFYMSLVLTGKYRGVEHLWTFYSNRVLRLFPTYFIAMLVTAGLAVAVQIRGSGERSLLITDLAKNLNGEPGGVVGLSLAAAIIPNLMLVGSDLLFLFHRTIDDHWILTYGAVSPAPDAVRMGGYLIVSPAWSVGLEVWFYLLIPFMVRWRPIVLAVIAALSFGLHQAMDAHTPWSSYFFFPANLGFFLTGTIAQRLWRDHDLGARLPGWLVLTGALGGLAALALREFIPFYRNYPGFHYTVAAIAIPLVFEVFESIRWDRWVGNLSYPVYIFHAAAIAFCADYLYSKNTFLVVLVTMAISILVTFALETPLERLRARRTREARPALATVPASEAS